MIELEEGLWATGDSTYVEKLERSLRLTSRESRSRARGSLALARWDFHQGDTDAALSRLAGVRPSDLSLQSELDLFRADCLCAQRQGQRALALLSRMTGRYTTDQTLRLRVGHARSLLGNSTDHGSGPVTEGLNGIYNAAGIGMIRRTSVHDPIGLDNISCEVPEAEPAESLPLVTIVLLVPDSLPEVHAGMSSLLNQSWRNLEIVVCGGPDVRHRLDAFDGEVLEDDRVVLVDDDAEQDHRLAQGLTRARGGLLTAHYYGSWAHPQRIEAQATALMVDPSLRAAVVPHLRVSSDLDPRPLAAAPRRDLVGPDPHSTMIRTSGLTPSEGFAAYDRVVAGYSPVTGGIDSIEDVAIVNDGVPLILTLADAWPETRPTGAGSQ